MRYILAVTDLSPELEIRVIEDVRLALSEDVGSGDLTAALVPAGQQAVASLLTREEALLCGTPWFNEVFRRLDSTIAIEWFADEGSQVKAGQTLCELKGSARPLLTGERSAMNFLQTLSATATAANTFVEAVRGTNATILDTRKTLPGLRQAQKYAVRTGGAANHRIGLYDGVLIKENHIAAAGSIAKAMQAALRESKGDDGILIEVEVESLDQLREAITAGAPRLLLDNFSLDQMREAVALRNALDEAVKLEASGNVNLKTVRNIADTGVDFISVGALTKDIRAIDLSMRFRIG